MICECVHLQVTFVNMQHEHCRLYPEDWKSSWKQRRRRLGLSGAILRTIACLAFRQHIDPNGTDG